MSFPSAALAEVETTRLAVELVASDGRHGALGTRSVRVLVVGQGKSFLKLADRGAPLVFGFL